MNGLLRHWIERFNSGTLQYNLELTIESGAVDGKVRFPCCQMGTISRSRQTTRRLCPSEGQANRADQQHITGGKRHFQCSFAHLPTSLNPWTRARGRGNLRRGGTSHERRFQPRPKRKRVMTIRRPTQPREPAGSYNQKPCATG